jgi:hypothetical protein
MPTPGTFSVLIAAEAADEAPAGALLTGEPAAVLEDDEPHAATVAAVVSASPPASSQLLTGPRRRLTLFLPIAPFISILLAPFCSVKATDCLRISLVDRPQLGCQSDAGFRPIALCYDRRRWRGLRAYPVDCFWVCRWCQM